jgi:excisionase family DNA binding protein
MKENVINANTATPILFPYNPEQFWQMIRQIIREEVSQTNQEKSISASSQTIGMLSKPLYKMTEVCALFHVTKPTIYEWVKHGKLKPYKIRSRVYFLEQDVKQLLHPKEQ